MRIKDSVFGLAVILSCVLPTAAQPSNTPPDIAVAGDLDSRWLPWLGCWQLSDEQMDRAAHESHGFNNASNFPDRALVCVTPADGASGVKLVTVAGGRVLVERTLVANATMRQVDEGNCQGWNHGEWSRDGRRLFTRAELRCGDSPLRSHSGISFMATRSTWVDIQLVDVGVHQHLEIRRYNPVNTSEHDELLGTPFALPVGPSEILRARRESAIPPTLLAVLDATQKTAARVVEAMLTETKPRVDLTSATLIELDDAGLDGDAIDLLVALSYPDQFVVKRRDHPEARLGGGFGRFYNPIWYGDLYPYYVTPLGHRYWSNGYAPYFYGRAASPFIALRNDLDDDPSGIAAIHARGHVSPPACRAAPIGVATAAALSLLVPARAARLAERLPQAGTRKAVAPAVVDGLRCRDDNSCCLVRDPACHRTDRPVDAEHVGMHGDAEEDQAPAPGAQYFALTQ